MTPLITAAAGTDPAPVYAALAALVRDTLPVRLFTVMEIDHRRNVAWRSYTNMPDAYPTSGEKPVENNAWTDQVQGRHETFVANSIQDIAAVFPDHALIQSLGCESCLNLPVVVAGQVLGTLNFLDGPGFFTPDRVAVIDGLKPAGTLALLAAERIRQGAA